MWLFYDRRRQVHGAGRALLLTISETLAHNTNRACHLQPPLIDAQPRLLESQSTAVPRRLSLPTSFSLPEWSSSPTFRHQTLDISLHNCSTHRYRFNPDRPSKPTNHYCHATIVHALHREPRQQHNTTPSGPCDHHRPHQQLKRLGRTISTSDGRQPLFPGGDQ